MSIEGRIVSMRQSTRRICRYCWQPGDEYNVLEGTNPTPPTGHDPKAMRDMDAHERVCEKNPNRKTSPSWWPF